MIATTRDEAFANARKYLDSYVAPHRLVNVSTFEEDHPNKSVFNVTILYRGPKPEVKQEDKGE